MADFITALTGENGLNATTIWGAITPVAGLVVTLTLVKLGYYMVSGSVNNFTRPNKKKTMR